MDHPDAPLPDDVVAELAAGRKIAAIQRLREHTGMGLAEAKAAVERHASAAPAAAARTAPDAQLPADVQAAIQRGETLDAVRRLRTQRGIGLKAAHDLVNAHARAIGVAAAPRPRLSTLALLAMGIGVAVMLAILNAG